MASNGHVVWQDKRSTKTGLYVMRIVMASTQKCVKYEADRWCNASLCVELLCKVKKWMCFTCKCYGE